MFIATGLENLEMQLDSSLECEQTVAKSGCMPLLTHHFPPLCSSLKGICSFFARGTTFADLGLAWDKLHMHQS